MTLRNQEDCEAERVACIGNESMQHFC